MRGEERDAACAIKRARPISRGMFITFFQALKSAGLPVSLREYLTLMEALDAGVAGYKTRNSTISRARAW